MAPTGTSTTQIPTVTSKPTVPLNTILNDLFVALSLAASIFVKNKDSQAHAASILSILQDILPTLGTL